MGIELILAAQLAGAAISPRGYVHEINYPRDSIPLRDSIGQGQVIEDITRETGYYAQTFDVPYPTDSVFITFFKNGDSARVRDLVSDISNGNRVPEVVLYASGQRRFTVSAYRLDTTNFRFSNLKGILENLTRIPSPIPDTAMLFGNDSLRALSALVSSIRAEPGDSLRLSMRGTRNDTIFRSDTMFIANDIGYGDAWPIQETLATPTRWNYGTWHIPVPRETIFPTFKDFRVSQILSPIGLVDSGEILTPQAWIKNCGYAPSDGNILVRIGSTYEKNTSFGTIQPGDSTLVSSDQWQALLRGNNPVKCSVMVSGDARPLNDALNDSVYVRVFGARPLTIDAPVDSVPLSEPLTPRATLENTGNVLADSMVGKFFIYQPDSSEVYSAKAVVENVSPGARPQLSFQLWQPETVGPHSCSLHMTAYSGGSSRGNSMLVRQSPKLDFNSLGPFNSVQGWLTNSFKVYDDSVGLEECSDDESPIKSYAPPIPSFMKIPYAQDLAAKYGIKFYNLLGSEVSSDALSSGNYFMRMKVKHGESKEAKDKTIRAILVEN